MNVYDFDKTIYAGDSTIDFYLYCLSKHKKIIKCLPKQILKFIQYKMRVIDKIEFKESFFCFLKLLDNIDDDINNFWDAHQEKIYLWYTAQQREDDIIVSASPEFLLKEIFKRMKIEHYLCSGVNKKNGRFYTPNCYGEEKVTRFMESYDIEKVNEFYSDSLSDLPMALHAEKAFLINKKGERRKWEVRCKETKQ